MAAVSADSVPVLFGASYSVYVRAARLALEEKGVPYRLEDVDIFADGGPPPDYRLRHPFLRIPAPTALGLPCTSLPVSPKGAYSWRRPSSYSEDTRSP